MSVHNGARASGPDRREHDVAVAPSLSLIQHANETLTYPLIVAKSGRVESTGLTNLSLNTPGATNARRQGLTNPSEGRLPAVPQRINTAVAPNEATVPKVASEWPTAVQPQESFLCMNPRCPEAVRITRNNTRGRPQLFCGTKCRRAYDYERAQLRLDHERLKAAVARPGGTFRERQVVEAALASVERCLLHYTYPGPTATQG